MQNSPLLSGNEKDISLPTATLREDSSIVDNSMVFSDAQTSQIPVRVAVQQDDCHEIDGQPMQKSELQNRTALLTVVPSPAIAQSSGQTGRPCNEDDKAHVNSAKETTGRSDVDTTQPQKSDQPKPVGADPSPDNAEISPTTPTVPTISERDESTTNLSSPHTLNAAAPAWSPPASCLLDEPIKFAKFLKSASPENAPAETEFKKTAAPAKSPEVEASSSPTVPRMSFIEALRKKTKKTDLSTLDDITHSPLFPAATSSRAAPVQPPQPQKGKHGGYMINLPILYNLRSAPGLDPPDSDEDDLVERHNAWVGRTRSTAARHEDDDGESEDLSD